MLHQGFTFTFLREMSSAERDDNTAPPTISRNTSLTAPRYASSTGALRADGSAGIASMLSRTALFTAAGRPGIRSSRVPSWLVKIALDILRWVVVRGEV